MRSAPVSALALLLLTSVAANAQSSRKLALEMSLDMESVGDAQFSPDGRWVAFVATLSGRPEVYVQSFPDGAQRTQVSTGGGTQTIAVTNNQIRQYNNMGLLLQLGDNTNGGNGAMNATVTGNVVANMPARVDASTQRG